jgi:hypothetical protein
MERMSAATQIRVSVQSSGSLIANRHHQLAPVLIGGDDSPPLAVVIVKRRALEGVLQATPLGNVGLCRSTCCIRRIPNTTDHSARNHKTDGSSHRSIAVG